MKSKLILILLLLFSAINYSQTQTKINFTKNDKLIYLDSSQVKTSESDHYYYRIIKDYKLNKNSYKVFQYYKSGALYMEGISSNKDWIEKNGLFVYYYENGNRGMMGNFIDRVADGEVTNWYENGNKKSVKHFVKGRAEGKYFEWYENGNNKREGVNSIETEELSDTKTSSRTFQVINQFWDVNGVQKVIDGTGDYEETAKNFKASGKLKNGYKDGVWKGQYTELDFSYSEIYNKNKLVSGISVDKNNVSANYTKIQAAPAPLRGMKDFYSYIAANFRVPKGVELKGKIYMSFIVDIDGSVEGIKVLRGLGQGTDEEAISVIKSYNGGWVPGALRGQKVKLSFSLPISIQTTK